MMSRAMIAWSAKVGAGGAADAAAGAIAPAANTAARTCLRLKEVSYSCDDLVTQPIRGSADTGCSRGTRPAGGDAFHAIALGAVPALASRLGRRWDWERGGAAEPRLVD